MAERSWGERWNNFRGNGDRKKPWKAPPIPPEHLPDPNPPERPSQPTAGWRSAFESSSRGNPPPPHRGEPEFVDYSKVIPDRNDPQWDRRPKSPSPEDISGVLWECGHMNSLERKNVCGVCGQRRHTSAGQQHRAYSGQESHNNLVCPHCGTSNRYAAVVCNSCGHILYADAEQPPGSDRSNQGYAGGRERYGDNRYQQGTGDGGGRQRTQYDYGHTDAEQTEAEKDPIKSAEILLGLRVPYTKQDVQKAMRNLLRIHHPDRNRGNEDAATKRTQEITEASNLLLADLNVKNI